MTTTSVRDEGNALGADHEAASFDAIVVGAGFAGLYALHRLRSEGLSVRVLDAAPRIGGTWYWNSYPGARCDVESADYSYTFSPELDQEWVWSERYAAQPEILRYLDYVADRFDLRGDIQLNTRVTAARYDESRVRWIIETDNGQSLSATYCIFATGGLSAPMAPPFRGAERFKGESYMTSLWPDQPIDFTGKRVAVIGTGSSGIQVVPEIAREAEHVFVFQRTPQYSVPARNHPLTEDDMAAIKATYPQRRARQRRSHTGLSIEVNPIPADQMSAEDQLRELSARWEEGGALAFTVAFGDVLTNITSNRIVRDFIAKKTRARIKDAQLADRVVQERIPFGARRPCADHGYYETLEGPNATLVDISENAIAEITSDGIRLKDGTDYPVDVIIYAIGYDAVTGAVTRIDVVGRDGVTVRDVWAVEPATYLGMTVAGFPNMFLISGPGSPLTMMVALGEAQVDWIASCVTELREHGVAAIEPTADAQEQWTTLVEELAEKSIYALDKNSYYYGANVPGKPRRFTLYLGGLGRYRKLCDQIAQDGYRNFRLTDTRGQVVELYGAADRTEAAIEK